LSRNAAATCLIGLVLLNGCGGPPLNTPHAVRSQAEVYHLHSVPFYADTSDQGGPSTLASVLTYWGFRTEPLVLREEIYMSRVGGMVAGGVATASLPMDLQEAAQARGLRAQSYSGTLENLKAEIRTGHPLVALLDGSPSVSTSRALQPRYVVIVGFDDRRQGLYLHSGLQPDVFITYSRFIQGWEKSGRWVLLILPPSMQGRNRI
jgi:Peptidase_C39 like family